MKKLTQRVTIRFTKEELEHLEKCFDSSCTQGENGGRREKFSAFLRVDLMRKSHYQDIRTEQQLRNLAYELRKIGTNINQIAKKVNSGFGNANDMLELKNDLRLINEKFEGLRKDVEKDWQSQN